MNVMTVIGARPQFIKAAPVSKALRERGIQEFLLHTGQHYNRNMSQVFFDELKIPTPNINLGIKSGSHGQQTGRMLEAIEQQILMEKPDILLVYGDTNSTLAGALAGAKLKVPVAHVEAGLRSWNREMPEETNRVLTDHCSNLLFCPTKNAVENLRKEGIEQNVYLVGDSMFDAMMHFHPMARENSSILEDQNLTDTQFFLTTLHRPSNVDKLIPLNGILSALNELPHPVFFPVHPRTQSKLSPDHAKRYPNILFSGPVGYLDMILLTSSAKAVLTDSGGLQKESYFLETPCITLREETEWTETLSNGANQIVGNDPLLIRNAVQNLSEDKITFDYNLFGRFKASDTISIYINNS